MEEEENIQVHDDGDVNNPWSGVSFGYEKTTPNEGTIQERFGVSGFEKVVGNVNGNNISLQQLAELVMHMAEKINYISFEERKENEELPSGREESAHGFRLVKPESSTTESTI